MKILISVFLIMCTTSVYSQFKVIYIPPDKLSKIKIDGNTDDWNWAPQKYFITGEMMNNNYLISTNAYNKEDWDCKILVGWNDVTNKLYIVATVFDDLKRSNSVLNPKVFDDNLQVLVNPDNLAGECWNKYAYADMYRLIKFTVHVSDTNVLLDFDYGSSWMSGNSETILFSGKNTNDLSNNSCITTYEIEMELWDQWSYLGPEFSRRHDLCSDKNIRMAIIIDDVDKSKNNKDDEWMTCYHPYWHALITKVPEFTLDQPSGRDDLWSNIISILKP